jgi:hypothetical protein
MHLTTLIAAAAALLPGIVDAHEGIPGAPHLFGRNAIRDLKARGVLSPRSYRRAEYYQDQKSHKKRGNKEARQTASGQCGPTYGSCAPGDCCSPAVSLVK